VQRQAEATVKFTTARRSGGVKAHRGDWRLAYLVALFESVAAPSAPRSGDSLVARWLPAGLRGQKIRKQDSI
jgi:hypothetical protein